MVCPPSRWSSCLPLSPIAFLFPFVGWCVHLPDGLLVSPLSPIVSLHVSLCWVACPPSRRSCLPLSPFVSHCTPSCFPLLDGVSTFPRPCLPLSAIALSPDMCACVGWRVRLPEGLVSLCLRLSPFLFPFVTSSWCVRLPEGPVSSCLPLSPFLLDVVSPCLALSPIVHYCFLFSPIISNLPSCFPLLDRVSAFPGLISPCLPLSPHMCGCVGWCVRLPEALSPIGSDCFPLSPHMCACVAWCVRLCGVLSPLVSHRLPMCVGLLDGVSVSAFRRSYLPLSPIVSPLVCLCWMTCLPSRGLVSPCLPLSPIVSPCLPLSLIVSPTCEPSRGLVSQLVFLLVSQLVSQLVSLLASLCGGWSHFAFFPKQCTVRGS